VRRIIPRRDIKKTIPNCKAKCCATKQQRFEWYAIYYSPSHNPICEAFSLMNQWLVATPAALLDKAQMWERKAKQFDYHLVPCPVFRITKNHIILSKKLSPKVVNNYFFRKKKLNFLNTHQVRIFEQILPIFFLLNFGKKLRNMAKNRRNLASSSQKIPKLCVPHYRVGTIKC